MARALQEGAPVGGKLLAELTIPEATSIREATFLRAPNQKVHQ